MRIWNHTENGDMELSLIRCERCQESTSASGDGMSRLREFIQITIDAGPDAQYFVAGESLVADLCERCAHELLSPCIRRIRSATGEIDFPFLNLDEMGIDAPDDDSCSEPKKL